MEKTLTLWEKVQKINEILLRGEPANIQTENRYGNVFTGYLPQAVVDAVNEVIGPEWAYTVEIISTTTADKSHHATVKVVVDICGIKREAFGGGTSPGSEGDALKSATTDALKKALAAFSIGNRAYLGLLVDPGANPEANGQKTPTSQKTPTTATTATSTSPIPPTPRQIRYLEALLRTVEGDMGFQRANKEYLARLQERIEKGITRGEASAAIAWFEAGNVKPTWETETKE